jgi:hypothetical protein
VEQYKIIDLGKSVRILIDYMQEGRQQRNSTDTEKAAVLTALEQLVYECRRCECEVQCIPTCATQCKQPVSTLTNCGNTNPLF